MHDQSDNTPGPEVPADDSTTSAAPGFVDGASTTPVEVSAKGSRLPQATIAMVMILAAGIAIVVTLSTGSGPEEASASDAAVEQQVDSFLTHSRVSAGDDDTDGMALVEQLSNYAVRRQVPIESLRSNPFSRHGERTGGPVNPIPQATKPAVRVANVKRRTELQREFSQLKLQGIMVSSRGATAIINSSFVTVGRKVGNFTVTEITPDRVELTCEQMPFTLDLQR